MGRESEGQKEGKKKIMCQDKESLIREGKK